VGVDEAELAELARRGWRYALSLTGDEARADDLVQEAWVATLRSGGGIHLGYLMAAIRSRWIDGWRHERIVELLPPDPVGMIPSPGGRFEAASLLAGPWAALREEEREALHLCVVEGYTAAEAAALMGCPRNTVLSLCHRARAKLRAAMTDASEVMP
jgi:RNA polymerase sigma-70 factor, ECF subfamily